MRRDPEAFADGLEEWRQGSDTLAAEAARTNVGALLNLWGQSLTDGKWSK